ncbi:uncharacterized protein [Halyomorpha halys]|uniref:uncharacterized protein n=1 Tax=Halyomorpha halys TaxID=286706 RepID=UPI0034D22FE9
MDHVIILDPDPLALDDEVSNEMPEKPEDKLYCCQVCNMILVGFSKYTPGEQAEIIRKGRPTPKLENLFTNTSSGKKSFCSKQYDYHEWLTGCEQRCKLYCWPCLLFSERANPWTTSGISDVVNLSYSAKSHSTWDIHFDAMFKWKTFGETSPSIVEDDEESLDHNESDKFVKEEEIMKNREILKKLIRIVCFLSVHELCLSEQEGGDLIDPIDPTKYEAFISYVGKYDHFLASQLSCYKVLCSPNNLISSIASVVTKYIFDEVSQSSFVSMILDEVAEMDDAALISTIIRYTNMKGELVERFLNFRRVSSNREADSLFSLINENINTLDCASKLISISCDGGVVKTEEVFILQNKIRAICPNTCFLNYYEHQVSTVLAQSLSNIKECKLFFWTLNGLAMSFFKSKKLRDELDVLIRKKKPDASEFRWNFNGSLISNVYGIRQPLIDLFQSIVNHKDSWDFESVSASNWFLPKLANDLVFNFLLLLLGDVFERADVLSNNLVLNSANLDLCIQYVNKYTKFVRKKKDSFGFVYKEAIRHTRFCESTMKRKKNIGNTELFSVESCKNLFQLVFSNINIQLNSRFGDLWQTKVTSLFTDFESLKSNFKDKELSYFTYKEFFHWLSLLTELSVLRESKTLKKNQRETLEYLRSMELSSTFPQTTMLCELSMTLPIHVGKSTLKHVAGYIQTSSIKHRMSPMAILKIEKDFIYEISKNSKFYDKIIEEFSEKEPSIPLIYQS